MDSPPSLPPTSPPPSAAPPPVPRPCPAAGDLVAEARRLRHLMRELARAGLDLRTHPRPAFAVVKVAEADRVLLGFLADLSLGRDAWGRAARGRDRAAYEALIPELAAIARDKRQRLLRDLPRAVRVPLLQGLETPAPPEGEVWALAGGLRRSGAREAFGGHPLPLTDPAARRLAGRLCARASVPATWEDLWSWS